MKSKSELIAEIALAEHPKTVVDIGYAQYPNTHFGNDTTVYGLDITSAPAPYNKTFICDLNKDPLPFPDEAIDVVTMGCTLAHVANPLRVLAEVNRVLKPGGMLITTSPNPNYYWETVLNVFYDTFKHRVSKAKHVEHFFEFSRYNMRTSTERTGFSLVKEVGYLFALVKTPFRFNPIHWPGLAYEIIYVLKKTGAPQAFATFETGTSIEHIPVELYR
jgi:ubiquinone/menaquinone biosynthesis C-methylase UbiE